MRARRKSGERGGRRGEFARRRLKELVVTEEGQGRKHTFGYMDGMASKTRTLPDQRSLFR